jgi:hypothetical protein
MGSNFYPGKTRADLDRGGTRNRPNNAVEELVNE